MRLKPALVALAVLSLGPVSFAQEIDIPYEKFVLNNGLTVVIHEDHKAPIVAVNVWYHVGSKNEKPGKTGFAHLFEHLMFEGSEHAKGRFVDAMERIGATGTDGETDNDRTCFYENVPSSALDFALWMESDRMGYLSFDQKMLDLQRGVVQNEKRQGENKPYGAAWELIPKNTYPPGHPYSWNPIGEMADLDAASMADVKEWFKTYYGPSNTVLVLAGDVDTKTAKEKVEKYFGNIPPGPPIAHHQAWIAKMTGTHRQIVQVPDPQARIYKLWNIPEYWTPDEDYLDLVSDVLTLGKSSRLYKRLVSDDQIALDANAYASLGESGGQFGIQVTARPGQDLRQVEKELDEELARFLREGPTPEELTRVKANHFADFVRESETVGGANGKSRLLAQGQIYFDRPDAYKISLDHVRNATPEDLRLAASRWLSDGAYVLEARPFPQLKAASVGADRSKAPDTGAALELRLPKLQRATLSNGLKVTLAERHETPLVHLWLVFDAGYAADQFTSPGSASMTTSLLDAGTTTRSAMQLSDQLLLLGAQLSATANLDQSLIEISALKSKLDDSLSLFADVALHPAFAQADFDRLQKLRLADIGKEENRPQQMALRILPSLLYGKSHAYGNPLTGSGTLESIRHTTRQDVANFYQTWFRPNNATLIVAGDITLADLTPKLEKLFAGWKPQQIPKKSIAAVPAPRSSSVYLINRPGSPQSTIIAGLLAPPPSPESEIAIEAMNDGLGGTFGSRLNMNLREEKHWSYGADSQLWPARGPRLFLAVAPVQADKTRESIEEMEEEFREIVGEHPLDTADLRRIQSSETLRLPGSRETLNALGSALLELLQFGFPDDYYDSYSRRVNGLTTGDLASAAKAVIHPDRIVWLVVGDRAKIDDSLRQLNLGEIRYLGPDGTLTH